MTTGRPLMSLPSASASGDFRLSYFSDLRISEIDVRDLQADERLARNHVDNAHADDRQAARDVLVQIADLTALYARRRLQLEARDDRPGMRTDDLRVDAEILELELHLARQRVERLLRIPLDLLLRLVEQGQRRQFTRRDAGEQRDLLFALGTLALFDWCEHGLDLERLALGLLDRVDLAHFLALEARSARDAHVLDLLRIRSEPAEGRVEAAPNRVHEPEP